MKNRKTPLKALILKALSAVMAAIMLVSVLASCGGDGNEGSDASNEQSYGETTTYTVSVKTAGGMVMAELDGYVYADSTLADMKNYAKTNIVIISATYNIEQIATHYNVHYLRKTTAQNFQESYNFLKDII